MEDLNTLYGAIKKVAAETEYEFNKRSKWADVKSWLFIMNAQVRVLRSLINDYENAGGKRNMFKYKIIADRDYNYYAEG